MVLIGTDDYYTEHDKKTITFLISLRVIKMSTYKKKNSSIPERHEYNENIYYCVSTRVHAGTVECLQVCTTSVCGLVRVCASASVCTTQIPNVLLNML